MGHALKYFVGTLLSELLIEATPLGNKVLIAKHFGFFMVVVSTSAVFVSSRKLDYSLNTSYIVISYYINHSIIYCSHIYKIYI